MPPKRGWDAQAHEALLLAFIEEFKPTKAVITQVTERMKAAGYHYSYDAINQHVQKLRKTRDSAALKSDGAAAADGGSSAPVTPSKRTPGGKAKKAKGKAAAAAANMQDNDEVDDDDDGGADLGKVFPPEAKVKVSASEGEEDEFPPEVLPPTKKGRKSRASQRKAEISLAEAASGMI